MKKLILLALILLSFNALATEDETPFKYPGATVSGTLGSFKDRRPEGVDLYQVRCNAPADEQGRVIAKVRTNIVGERKPYGSIVVQILQGDRASLIKGAAFPIAAQPMFRESKWTVLDKVDCNKNFTLAVSKRNPNEPRPKYISDYKTTFACQSNKGWIYPVSYRLVQNQ